MTFYKEDVDQQVIDWHKRLRDALIAKKMYKTALLVKSVNEFRVLKKTYPEDKIDLVLDWYCKHAGEEFVPRVDGAKAFRMKFEDIVRAMEREGGVRQVSAEAELMAKEALAINAWPVEVASVLPQIVQKSLDEWRLFSLFLSEIQETEFVKNVCQYFSIHFVDVWLATLHIKFGYREHYIGNPMDLAFSPSKSLFRESFWRKWSYQWTTQPNQFDKLLDDLLLKYKESRDVGA